MNEFIWKPDFRDWHWATINTDISYNPTSKVAAWAMYVNGDKCGRHQFAGVFNGLYDPKPHYKNTNITTSLLEFQAIVNAMLIMNRQFKEINCIRVNTDNANAIDMIERGIAHEGCDKPFGVYKNLATKFRFIKMVKVKGHSDIGDKRHFINNKVDKIAREVRQRYEKENGLWIDKTTKKV